MEFQRAFYIKLGKAGEWAVDSIQNGLLRFGWNETALELIHQQTWDAIQAGLTASWASKLVAPSSLRGVVTRDVRALHHLVESGPGDVWITFYGSRLWWARLAEGLVEEDGWSKFRRTQGAWSDRDERGNILVSAELPGKLSSIEGFRGTVCRVGPGAVLRRVLSGEGSPEAAMISDAAALLVDAVDKGIRELHWRDFEILVDLVFRQSGWRRISMIGGGMTYADLELEDTITGDRYQVQVKSVAGAADAEAYAAAFGQSSFRRLYFVVHSPTADLTDTTPTSSNVEVVGPRRLADMVVRAGLTDWLLGKLR